MLRLIAFVQTEALRLWLWFKTQVAARRATPVLGALSFGESFLFAIPIDAFLAAVVLADRERWARIAFFTTMTSTAGAVVGYLIGFFAFDWLGPWFIGVTEGSRFITRIIALFEDHAALLTFAAALTPIPNGPIVIAAGFVGSNFLLFILAWVVGRAVRFYAVAYVAYAFGSATLSKTERALNIGTVLIVLVALGWVVYKAAGI